MIQTTANDIIQRTFNRPCVVLPVIHVVGLGQAVRNVEVALAAGADGVFLISHTYENEDLLRIVRVLKVSSPPFFVGLNLLGLSSMHAYEDAFNAGANGLWVDNPKGAGINLKNQGLLYFGGVAFKTQPRVPDEDLAQHVQGASETMDVVCTSGPSTGVPEDARRLRIMSNALVGRAPLAVASGVTPHNVQEHLDAGVRAILVATGVSKDFHELDPQLLAALVKQVHHG